MKCVACGAKTRIFDSRPTADEKGPWRRHSCPAGHRFTTREVEIEELKRLRATDKKYKALVGLIREELT